MVGTGDLSELALGWATYNGDHMSMYGVTGTPGCPKTLVRHLVHYEADIAATDALRTVLLDILDTPVSPELLPAKDGEIAQKTEDLVGPYELHDFYLYQVLRFGFGPAKIFRLAKAAFAGRPELPRQRAVQVAAQLLLAVLRPSSSSAAACRTAPGGQRDPFAPRRLAHAQRCLCRPLARRTGTAFRSRTDT